MRVKLKYASRFLPSDQGLRMGWTRLLQDPAQHPEKQPTTTLPLASIGIDDGKEAFHIVGIWR